MPTVVPHTDSDVEMRRAIQRLRKDKDIGDGGNSVKLENNNAGALIIGTPVYSDGAGTVDKAQANAAGTIGVVGLVQPTEIAATEKGEIQTNGVLAATATQWDAITSESGGLTADAVYYLSAATAGLLTATAPTSAGQFVVRVGRALSATQMVIQIQQPVAL